MKYNRDIHHRRSVRLREYDYSRPGMYFITICTQNKECLFGDVVDGEMVLNEHGRIARDEWVRAGGLRAEIELGQFVVMPNHLHGIVIIRRNAVGATGRSPLQTRRGPQPKSLGAFVAGFKPAVTRRINKLNDSPGVSVWQRNYYEHVVRDENELARIREYIANNPAKWEFDRENPMVSLGNRQGRQDEPWA